MADEGEDGSDALSAYLEYNKVLRTWFVAFGVGGPALFLVNDAVAKRLAAIGSLRCVAILFMAGAAAQVLGALLNKGANYYQYLSSIDDGIIGSRRYEVSEWLIRQYWIDVVVDLVTVDCFGVAAWHILTVFTQAV